MKARFVAIAMALGMALSVHAQSKVEYLSAKDLQDKLAALAPEAKSKGSSGSVLSESPTHALRLSVRTSSGGAEVHAHFDDVILVTQGQATLITGGTVVDGKTSDAGETQGSGISNGDTRIISTGDIIHIPAGTPHQMKIAPGTLFSAFVVKVHEQ